MIEQTKNGFYAVSFGGGQVEPATGDFVFGVSEGYLIEDGKVTSPCTGATLIGNCLDALAAIDAVGDDFFMKTGICGKGGQRVPVGTGQGHASRAPRVEAHDDDRIAVAERNRERARVAPRGLKHDLQVGTIGVWQRPDIRVGLEQVARELTFACRKVAQALRGVARQGLP